MGEGVAPAVVGSVTTRLSPAARGAEAVREMMLGELGRDVTAIVTGFESSGTAPGLETCTEMIPALATSVGSSMVVHRPDMGQLVTRGDPLMRICDELLEVVGIKFSPCTANRKLLGVPARTLEGRIVSITGPDSNATVAVADAEGSARLVAKMEIAFGDGAVAGAV